MCCEGVYFPNQALLSHTCQPLPCFPCPDGVVFHISTMQIQLRLISLTWEKFLALILTSFSTSCCRWKVSSCSLFSASSLLLLSSSSIWRRARLSRSWEDSTFIKYFFWSVSRLHRKKHVLRSLCSQNSAWHSYIYAHLFLLRAVGHRLALNTRLLAIWRSNVDATTHTHTYEASIRTEERPQIQQFLRFLLFYCLFVLFYSVNSTLLHLAWAEKKGKISVLTLQKRLSKTAISLNLIQILP